MSLLIHQAESTNDIKNIGLLKFEILASGLRVSREAMEFVKHSKSPIRTRSGASGGLDLILPNRIHVNAPITEAFAPRSELVLDCLSEALVIRRGEEIVSSAQLQPVPKYYGELTANGVPMVKVGQMCSGDRFCYGMTGPYCWFWKPERRCKYCSIGLNRDRDASRKTIDDLLETLRRSADDPAIPARHVLIGGGTPDGDDMGAIRASDLCRAIKSESDLSCYVMICAPLKNEYIDMLRDSGADEIGMNIEFYSEAAWEQIIPGKNRFIGRKRYLEALEYAVSLFGPINVRSLIVVGLEERRFTIEGAEQLASMGVMPILSPFRPLVGTELEDSRGFDHLTYWEIYTEVHRLAMQYGIPTGPTCIPCQNNVLALPLLDGPYRFY